MRIVLTCYKLIQNITSYPKREKIKNRIKMFSLEIDTKEEKTAKATQQQQKLFGPCGKIIYYISCHFI